MLLREYLTEYTKEELLGSGKKFWKSESVRGLRKSDLIDKNC